MLIVRTDPIFSYEAASSSSECTTESPSMLSASAHGYPVGNLDRF